MTIVPFPLKRPGGAALRHGTGRAMDVILHIGAHRCATTSFQNYLRHNAERLAVQGVGFWGPHRTRGGLLRGVIPRPGPAIWRHPQRRAAGRVRLALDRCERRGVRTLMVSDENVLGSMRDNRMAADLYPAAGERVARHAAAFGDRLSAVVLNVRALDHYWASVLGYGVARGFGLPGARRLEAIAAGSRGWRDVVTDVACAAPGAEILVLPFERFAGRPEAQLRVMADCDAPASHARERVNATPRLPRLRELLPASEAACLPDGDGRWMPFSTRQVADLKERYADDLLWLASGAGGLAQLVEDDTDTAGKNPRAQMTRGRQDDQDQGRLAGAGRERAARPAAG